MEQEIIEIENDSGAPALIVMTGKNRKNVVFSQVGLGEVVEGHKFTRSLQQATKGGIFSLATINHPLHVAGNIQTDSPEFKLALCRSSTKQALQRILGMPEIEKVVCVGYSLGFWSIFQALGTMEKSQKIQGILGKSGIHSYERILLRFLGKHGYPQNKQQAWSKLFEEFNMDPNSGVGQMPVLPDSPIPVHRNFLISARNMNEVSACGYNLVCWHGLYDHWSTPEEIRTLGPDELHTFELGHSLRPNRSIDLDIISTAEKLFTAH